MIQRLNKIFRRTFIALNLVVLAVASFSSSAQAYDAKAPTQQGGSVYWLGEFFNNTTLSGNPVLRRATRALAFNWGRGSPSRSIARDNFSARWTRIYNLLAGTYRITTIADDGVRVWVDNRLVIDAWADGPARTNQSDVSLGGQHVVRVEYYERTNLASIRVGISRLAATQPSSTRWRAEFYNNVELAGSPVFVRDDIFVDFNWAGNAPDSRIPADNFSVRWTWRGAVTPGTYTLVARVDDGVRVYVDGNLVINEWREGPPREVSANITLSSFASYRVEYFDRGGNAQIQILLIPHNPAPIPSTATAPPPIVTNFPDWRAEYYNNVSLIGAPVLVRNDTNIYFNFGNGSPDPRVAADNFSARWTGRPQLSQGRYRINVRVDDGVRVYVNGSVVIDSWIDGPPREYNAEIDVGPTPPEVRVEYFERSLGSIIQVQFIPTSNYPDWKAEYFSGTSVDVAPAFIRNDTAINFDWGNGTPDSRIGIDNFAVRWSRRMNLGGGNYRVEATMDDGMRVWVDGRLLVDEWRDLPVRTRTVDIFLNGGDHDFRVDYYEHGDKAVAKFNIFRINPTPNPLPSPTAIPQPTPIP
jgi:single-stranded DNA-binding protein